MTNKDVVVLSFKQLCSLPHILFSILAKKTEKGEAYLHLSLLCLKWAPFCQPIPHSFWTPFKSKMQPKFHHGTQLQNQGNKRVKTLWGKNGANTWKVSRKGEKNILIIFTTSSSSGFANSCTCQPVFSSPLLRSRSLIVLCQNIGQVRKNGCQYIILLDRVCVITLCNLSLRVLFTYVGQWHATLTLIAYPLYFQKEKPFLLLPYTYYLYGYRYLRYFVRKCHR